jgi:hypothetical protein
VLLIAIALTLSKRLLRMEKQGLLTHKSGGGRGGKYVYEVVKV